MSMNINDLFFLSLRIYNTGLWIKEKYSSFKYRKWNNFEKCSKCELLRFCRGCPAVSYGYTHDMYSADPQCWKEID